jgi:hypothetical protein
MPNVSYNPNDPGAVGGPPQRTVAAGKFPAGASFSVKPIARAGTYKPLTPEYDYWQVQTALIAGMNTWKAMDGKALPKWWGNKPVLPALTNAGDDLNAFYDRASLQFFAHTFGGVTVHSAESVDVVTHEQGHAILDAIRPDFWNAPFIEIGGFHEAFGDCIALLTALTDKVICDRVVATSPDLSGPHFVEALAEQLGDAIAREYGPGSVEAGALRHALNNFRWSDPTKLPPNAPANQLAGEVHSFARVFVGAFYDTIRNMYNASGTKTSAGLQRAAAHAGGLLIQAVRTAPAAPRLFEAVGKRMLQAEASLKGGNYAKQVRDAFDRHGMTLPAPAASLPEALPSRTPSDAAKELRKRMGVPAGARLETTKVDSEMHKNLEHVTAFRKVPLTGVLRGVTVNVPASARVTRRGGSTNVIGDAVAGTSDADNEARAFAQTLVESGDIRIAPKLTRRIQVPIAPRGRRPPRKPTHEIKIDKGQPTLVRVGFA